MFFLKVEGVEDELTKSEKKLVQYIKENLVLVKKYNVMDLAEKSGVSAPSIIRLAKKLQYNGFLDMKIDLNKTREYSLEENSFLEKLLENCKEKVLSLPPTVTLENILVITKYIKNSNKIMLIAEDEFLNFKNFVYSRLLLSGKNMFLDLGLENNNKLLKYFQKNDLILVIAKNLSKDTKQLLENYKDLGFNSIFIGESLKSEDRCILDVDLDLTLDVVNNFFVYSLVFESILKFV